MYDRHDRANSLLRELAARFIQENANSSPLITVTHVDVSLDYHYATIYFTTLPDGREADALIFLERTASELRHFILKESRLKHLPFFRFAIDMGERHRQHVDEVMEDINHKK